MQRIIVAIVALLISSASMAQDWRQQGYDSVAASVASRVKEKRITTSQANREMADAVRTYFPNDHLTMRTWDQLAEQAARMERGELSKDAYDEYVNQAWRRLEADKANMMAQQQQEHERQQRAAIIGGALQGAAAGASNIGRRPGVSCTSQRYGDMVQTICN